MSAVEYAIAVAPRQAVLGQPILARVSCKATSHVAGALTFDHRSLVLELTREGWVEPALAFPNRFAVEEGGRLIRISSPGGVEDLQAGDARARTFDLTALFPRQVLAPGAFSVTYRVEEAAPAAPPAAPIVRPEPIAVAVGSGPAAIPHLVELLGSDSIATRACAAELLAAMTAEDFGYRADGAPAEREAAVRRWRAWWAGTGAWLPWSFDATGATFGEDPGPAPASGLGPALGGVAHPARGPRS